MEDVKNMKRRLNLVEVVTKEKTWHVFSNLTHYQIDREVNLLKSIFEQEQF